MHDLRVIQPAYGLGAQQAAIYVQILTLSDCSKPDKGNCDDSGLHGVEVAVGEIAGSKSGKACWKRLWWASGEAFDAANKYRPLVEHDSGVYQCRVTAGGESVGHREHYESVLFAYEPSHVRVTFYALNQG